MRNSVSSVGLTDPHDSKRVQNVRVGVPLQGLPRRPHFDTVSVEIDGKAVGATLDAYAPAVLPSGPIEVGSGIELTKGQHRVRFTVIGTNSASLGHGFGVDCLELRP
jgi:hypothetical protein